MFFLLYRQNDIDKIIEGNYQITSSINSRVTLLFFIFLFFFLFQYNFIEHTHVQLTFTKDNLQLNENYNLKLTKKET